MTWSSTDFESVVHSIQQNSTVVHSYDHFTSFNSVLCFSLKSLFKKGKCVQTPGDLADHVTLHICCIVTGNHITQ